MKTDVPQMMRQLTSAKVGIAVYCTVCRLRKKPRGRSAALVVANSLCDSDCPGYTTDPLVGDLWPGESEKDFGFPCGNEGTAIRLLSTSAAEVSPTGEPLENVRLCPRCNTFDIDGDMEICPSCEDEITEEYPDGQWTNTPQGWVYE